MQVQSVFFDFDSTALKPEQLATVETQGHMLASHPAFTARVEGNTDERGSSEYNLALGQRRAEAVQKALILVGAKPDQLEAVSWGKDKPLAPGHDENAWAQNRRADITPGPQAVAH